MDLVLEESWVVLADPEGNEFCVLSSGKPDPVAVAGPPAVDPR